MAITKEQLIELGFQPSKLAKGTNKNRKYDTLVFPINSTDYLFTGFNNVNGKIDFKRIWKSFNSPDGRITYPVSHTGELSFTALKEYIQSTLDIENMKVELEYDKEIEEDY